MPNFDLKKIMQWLGQILKCPICGFKYSFNQTKVVQSREDRAFDEADMIIHSDCKKCKSSVMFNIEIRGPEIFSIGMVTDLTGQDSAKFFKKNSISTDEVIALHHGLKTFKGDFISLLQK